MMRNVLKMKWFIIVLWLVVSIGLLFIAPSMGDLVRDKGQITIPEGYSSSLAQEMIAEMQEQRGRGEETQLVLVFHDPQGLTDQHLLEIEQAVYHLMSQQSELGITTLISHFFQQELTPQFVSSDGKTIMISLSIDWADRTIQEIREDLYAALDHVKVDHYLTGSLLIDEDLVVSSQEGLRKTEYITVIFILAILFIVFRSVVAPLIPLLTVGISYLLAQSIVAFLVDLADFPISTFTQIFMVAVMFGIGTDYCILLISRFKEELASHNNDVTQAIIETYRHAGRTVLVSAVAVLIGFASIGFSQFSLFKSAVAVAVGIAVLMIALVTIVPFFLAVFGRKLFWPVKGEITHQESKLWKMAGNFSLKRSFLSLLIVAAFVVPFLWSYDGDLSFNSMDEISDQYDSVKAFRLISDGFGPGDTMPATVVIQHTVPWDQPDGMAMIEQISQELAQLDGVKLVRSVTRPMGEVVDLQAIAQYDPNIMEQVIQTFMSPDRTIHTLDVVFDEHPYATETMEKIGLIENAIDQTLQGTDFASAKVAIDGVTSINRDLQQISEEDFKRTAMFMLAGIAIILILLFRSLIIPVYVIVSLLLTYFTSMAITEVIFVNIAGYSGLSWAAPFFTFVMLIALGVDYSIFLMDRFKEYKAMPAAEGIHLAMRNMGTVIISAVIILGGTFAAMLPSGVLSILQIATTVLAGLFLYSFVFLPFYIPVMVKWFGKVNWWPFHIQGGN